MFWSATRTGLTGESPTRNRGRRDSRQVGARVCVCVCIIIYIAID